ncbi:MAG: enolase C-terminal domain-like protein, partial [Thermoleophilaceae bacterium]
MRAAAASVEAAIESVTVSAYEIPTDSPESDGTLEWQSTTLVLVEVGGGGERGLGFTYADRAAATLIEGKLAAVVRGADVLSPQAAWAAMQAAVRNLGRQALSAMAISAVDIALWDLKARFLGVALADLLGRFHAQVPVYGSGGFTSYSNERLAEQLGGWAADGIPRVKMKVGRDPAQDPQRVRWAREVIGPDTQLFVDANGACTSTQALALAQRFADADVRWFEEPVSSDDLAGLRLCRERAPAGMAIAAGEYGFDLLHFRGLLEAGAVDVLQADATRCGGLTGFMAAAALCQAHAVPLSSHCAPALHVAACCCAPTAVHMEWFHDHERIESLLFDGAP